MKLVLVESPTKARTLSRFLGKDYLIEATMGHIRDLPKGEMGIDIEHDFTPKYVIPRDKNKRVNELRSLAGNKELIILATDPDREGEAIAWHAMNILLNRHQPKKKQKIQAESRKLTAESFQRITFHEITKEAIEQALKNPGQINLQLVNAQQARRVLDRLVGYELSPLLWKKLSRRWLSAGRVQSVALRLIAEREREIEKFKKEEYWVIEGEFQKSQIPNLLAKPDPALQDNDQKINAKLNAKNGIKYEQSQTIKLFDGDYTYSRTIITHRQAADSIIKDFQEPFTVSAVYRKETKRFPAPPFTTSTLQIDAGRRMGFTAKKTMQLAQKLYEEGLITYHRTDSVNLASKFLFTAKAYIEKNYGKSYSHYRTYTTKSKLAQEAHEAIRPTSVKISNLNDQISKNNLNKDHQRLFELIWKRAVASQMTEAIFDSTTIDITSANGYQFETQGSVVKFDGFLKVAGYDAQTIVLPIVGVGEQLKLKKTNPAQKFTTPPPRYSEATLIKALEQHGIGRPSTYAPTLSTIQERQYVAKEIKDDGKTGNKFIPTELGLLVNDFLVKYFPDIVDLPFTAKIEEELDDIARGKDLWVPLIRDFYTPFAKKLTKVEETAEKAVVPVEKTGKACPKCQQGQEVIKQGRFGKFLACSRFPECKYAQNFVEKLDMKCPQCQVGDVVVKRTKKGYRFYGCSRYPSCKWASWKKPEIQSTN